jgi:hypothetical protein
MKPLPVLVLILTVVLASCSPATTLYVDGVFRLAAPEIVDAWAGLAPGRPATVRDLPREAAAELRNILPASGTALVGAALTPVERTSLTQAFPRVRLVFFVPASEAEGQADIAVSRDDAWAAVARAAAVRGTATALFPADVSSDELDGFAKAWKQSGGGPLTSLVWPVNAIPGSDPLFQWAGSSAQALVKALPAGRPVHTDPGLERPSSSRGMTWRIRRQGLGDFLWNAAADTKKTVYFLPLEATTDMSQ